eukprot:GHVU01216334.1.p2 GENE.GHVU01216334.1~~GHVU01216334.1.p2  ORF type:complete len:142 (+),score=9.19 GHVU01216334.1:475-900(+)
MSRTGTPFATGPRWRHLAHTHTHTHTHAHKYTCNTNIHTHTHTCHTDTRSTMRPRIPAMNNWVGIASSGGRGLRLDRRRGGGSAAACGAAASAPTGSLPCPVRLGGLPVSHGRKVLDQSPLGQQAAEPSLSRSGGVDARGS